MRIPSHILPIIVFSQFCCTSLWFAGNAVMPEIIETYHLGQHVLGHLTSAVQSGFIIGTLAFAFFTLSDRFSPSKVFFFCAILGALFNLGILIDGNTLYSILAFKFCTGISLAGIYPVGMKIASDYFDKGLGRSLGYLVGALVLGTAFPHLLKELSGSIELNWNMVIYLTSILAVLGGLLIFFLIPDGPYRKGRSVPDLALFFKVFKNQKFRSAALGYFGHMWELYAFWAFIPVILSYYKEIHLSSNFSTSLMSFVIIGIGGLACVAGGYISRTLGVKKTAAIALSFSGICCLVSPLILLSGSQVILIVFMIFWGMMVVADSPLFSTLVAQNTPPDSRGTALTIVNCVGFSITIISIQLLNYLSGTISPGWIFLSLAVGPIFGLMGLFSKRLFTK